MLLQHRILDITDFKEKGIELMTAIENAVGDTQRVIITPLPDELLMTQDQFDELMRLSGLHEMEGTEDRMFITKFNVMEVRVKQ